MSGNDINDTKLENVQSDIPSDDDNNLKNNLKLEGYFSFPNVRPAAQGNNERSSLKALLFHSEEEKEDYAKQYFAVQKIQNQYIKYKSISDNVVFVQTRLRTKLAKMEYKRMKMIKKMSAQRTQVVMELYATEINYVSNLEKIVNCFMKPLRAIFDDSKKGGITKENIDSIFCNIEDILVKHQEFLKQLKQIVDQWSNETLLSPLFENIHEYISTYIPYFNNYENSYFTIEKCKKVPAFEESIKMVEGVKKLERNDLKSLLILPVQRIPRYILYLKEILKHTWPSHPDYDGLKIEISRIDDDIKILNRWKKFSENKETFELLQNQIKRQNIEVKGKKYVSEGSVLFQYSTMKETLKNPLPTYIYLFNDILLLTKTSVSKFTRIPRLSIIKAIPLTGIQIGELSQTNNPEYQHFMSLTLQDHSILTLYLENNEQKDKWIDDFQRVLYHIHSEMSDLLTVGDDESNFSNSQVVSVNGEEDREPRPLHTRLSEVDESALNSPSLKSASPIKLNSGYRKDDYYSEEESPKSPDKRKDSKSKKKGKEKLSPDGKGFLSHMKNFLDESKIKFEKGSLDSLESPVDRKTLSKSNRKYKSKDSLNVNSDADVPLYGSYNNILGGSDADGAILRGAKLKKYSFHDSNFYSSQCSVDRGEDDSNTTRVARDTTETSSVLTGDNATLDGSNLNDNFHNYDIRGSDAIYENENDSSTDLSRLSLRRNGQGNIFNEKSPMTPDSNVLMNYDNNSNNNININDDTSSNHSKKDRISESFKEGYTWVLKDIRDLGRHRHHSNDNSSINSPNSTK